MLKFSNVPISWKDEYTKLEYYHKPLPVALTHEWINQGHLHVPRQGVLFDESAGRQLPSFVEDVKEFFPQLKNIGSAFYRMNGVTVMPPNRDNYETYSKLFNVEKKDVRRVLIFLEDWKHGHYFEIDGAQYSNWKAGSCVMWTDEIHAAGNTGNEPRYTLQLTGHV